MAGLIPTSATFFLIVTFLVAEVALNKHYQCSGVGPENLSTTLVYLAIAIALVTQPVVLPALSWQPSWGWGIVLGVFVAILMHCLHLWARLHLGRMYSYRYIIEKGHTLVDTGPYRYIRHPLYVSYFLLAIAIFVINISVITGLFVIVVVVFYFYYWVPLEEASLWTNAPGYAEYMERTPRFFPKPWRGL